jgi:hypothetical protein
VADRDTLAALTQDVAVAFEPLALALESPEDFVGFMLDLGWDLDSIPPPLQGLAEALPALLDVLETGEVEATTVAAALAALASVLQAIRAIESQPATGYPDTVDVAEFTREFPAQVVDHLLVTHLLARRGNWGHLLKLLGAISVEEVDEAGKRPAYVRYSIAWTDLARGLDDPFAVFRDAYQWGTASFAQGRFAANAGDLARAWGLDAVFGWPEPALHEALTANAAATDDVHQYVLQLPLIEAEFGGADVSAGVGLFPLPPTASALPGFAVLPYAVGLAVESFALSERLSLVLEGRIGAAGGAGIFVRPNEPIQPRFDIVGGGGGPPPATGELSLALRAQGGAGDALVLVGSRDGSRIQITSASIRAGARVAGANSYEAYAEIDLQGTRLVVRPGDSADAFVASMLPDDGIDVDVGALRVGLSNVHGLYFGGSGTLEVVLPSRLRIGPIEVQSSTLTVLPEADAIPITVGATVKGALGPVTAIVDRVGLRAVASFPDDRGGNLGPVDFALAFKPPSGVALEIDTGTVTGGGYLFYDPQHEQYAGAMQLELSGISVKAVGLLTTRMPNGSRGFSLLVIISAEFTPIQLGLGFTLNAVGGLVGVNRTVAVEPLRAGLKSNSLASILFPRDPVGNARQLVASLSVVFPPAAGRFLFGPMARIGWGTPTLFTIDICLVLELPAPVRLVVLGRLRAVLPDEQAAVVRVQMDVLGVIDFDRREAAADATLVDSRLASFPLTGDMAMRLSWGANPSFLLAVGGFNPRFLPPSGFPRLDRITVALATSDNPRLRLEAYLALTSNTVQLGARLDLSVKTGPFGVVGFLSFDALVQLRPLSFVVDIAGSVAVKSGSSTILSLTLKLTLSGPEPWRARGRASFSILFFDVSISFDVTIGREPPPLPPRTVDVALLLLAALRDVRSWDAQLPVGGEALVTLRSLAPGSAIFAHPLGSLQVRQRVVPLERTLDRFGSEVPGGARFFRVAGATLAGVAAETEPLEDLFAPAQFTALTDDQKLSQPSFVSMRSGVRVGEHDAAHGTPLSVEVVFEQKVVSRA